MTAPTQRFTKRELNWMRKWRSQAHLRSGDAGRPITTQEWDIFLRKLENDISTEKFAFEGLKWINVRNTGVTLLEVLADPRQAARKAGGLGLKGYRPSPVPHPRHHQRIESQLVAQMREYLDRSEGEHIPPLAQLTSFLGVTPGFVLHRNPLLYQEYMARRKSLCKIRKERVVARVRQALDAGLFAIYLDGTIGSQDALVEELCRQCRVGKRVARTQVALYYRGHMANVCIVST